MIKRGLVQAWQKTRHYFKSLSPTRLALVITTSVLALVLGTYGVWQLERIISPQSGIQIQNGVSFQLKSSDHDASLNPLTNSVANTTTPKYDDTHTTIVILNGSTYNIPRFEGQIFFK